VVKETMKFFIINILVSGRIVLDTILGMDVDIYIEDILNTHQKLIKEIKLQYV